MGKKFQNETVKEEINSVALEKYDFENLDDYIS